MSLDINSQQPKMLILEICALKTNLKHRIGVFLSIETYYFSAIDLPDQLTDAWPELKERTLFSAHPVTTKSAWCQFSLAALKCFKLAALKSESEGPEGPLIENFF